MRIAIVVPRSFNKKQVYREYPLGAGYIGTVLHNMGNEVKVYDQNVEYFENQDLVNDIISYDPDFIAFSILTATYPTAIEIIELLKTMNVNKLLLAGGIHPSLYPIECIEDGFDFVIKGEGEVPIEKFVKYLDGDCTVDSVPNLVYREGDIIVNKPNVQLDINVNELPIINRKLFNMDKYSTHSISGTRGCPFSCKFCCNYNNLTNLSLKNRNRCVESVVEEIEYLCNEYNNVDIFFTDDVFFANINNLRKFEQLIREKKLNIRFNAQLRVNMITDEVCRLLISSGCKKIEVGVEAGSEKILRDACKGISIDNVKNGIKIAKENGIRIKTNWIYGLPGEMKEQYKSINLMIETMPNEISIHQLIPFPGTEYYDNRQEYGIIIKEPTNFKSFCYGELDDNITYKYMSKKQYLKLMYETIVELEKVGYVSSDVKTSDSKYVYSTPFDKKSLEPVSYKGGE